MAQKGSTGRESWTLKQRGKEAKKYKPYVEKQQIMTFESLFLLHAKGMDIYSLRCVDNGRSLDSIGEGILGPNTVP